MLYTSLVGHIVSCAAGKLCLWISVFYVILCLFLCYIILRTSVLNQVFENVWLIFHSRELKQRSKGRALALVMHAKQSNHEKKRPGYDGFMK